MRLLIICQLPYLRTFRYLFLEFCVTIGNLFFTYRNPSPTICLHQCHVIYVARRSVNTCTLIYADAVFSSALDGVHWSALRLGRFFLQIRSHGTVKIGFVGPKNRSGRFGEHQGVFSLMGIEPQLIGHPARS